MVKNGALECIPLQERLAQRRAGASCLEAVLMLAGYAVTRWDEARRACEIEKMELVDGEGSVIEVNSPEWLPRAGCRCSIASARVCP